MPAHLADEEVLESTAPSAMAIIGDAEIDIQVATAKRFPRSITTFMRRAQEMATLTPEIAGSCIYAIPRDGKTIEGPSARFAEVLLNAWGNMRAEGRTLGDDGQYVSSRGVAWDLESNTAVGYEVKRRITNRRGETYNADMITVTGNAGASIALRNAILKAIPAPFWKPIYNACRQVVAGDARTFQTRRDNMLHEFAVMGVTEERLCTALNLKGKLDITLDHMATLAGFFTALKDGDTTIEEAFPESGGLGSPQPAQRKSQQPAAEAAAVPRNGGPSAAPVAAAPAGAAPSPVADTGRSSSALNIGTVADILARGKGALVKLSTGFQAATADAELIRGLEMAKASGLRIELVTKAPSDPKFAPVITEILPADEAAK